MATGENKVQYNLLIEKMNDQEKYYYKATQEDIDAL